MKTGQLVRPDTIIGKIGDNGKIKDSYIHFDIRFGEALVVNPGSFIQFDAR